MKKLINQILKFGVVGFTAFFIDLGVFTVLSSVFHIYYLIANCISFTVSLVFNYVMSMKYVFERKEDADKRVEFVIFTVLSVIGLGINSLVIFICLDGIYNHVPLLRRLIGRGLAETGGKVVATAVVMVYNFITRKIFLEKKGE